MINIRKFRGNKTGLISDCSYSIKLKNESATFSDVLDLIKILDSNAEYINLSDTLHSIFKTDKFIGICQDIPYFDLNLGTLIELPVFKETQIGFIHLYNITFYTSSLKLIDLQELAGLFKQTATLRNSNFTYPNLDEFYNKNLLIVIN